MNWPPDFILAAVSSPYDGSWCVRVYDGNAAGTVEGVAGVTKGTADRIAAILRATNPGARVAVHRTTTGDEGNDR